MWLPKPDDTESNGLGGPMDAEDSVKILDLA